MSAKDTLVEAVRAFVTHRPLMTMGSDQAVFEKMEEALDAFDVENVTDQYIRPENLVIRGWWCICHIFNGEEHSKRIVCRSCGREKPGQSAL